MKLFNFLFSSSLGFLGINLRNLTDRLIDWDNQWDNVIESIPENLEVTQHWNRELEDADGNALGKIVDDDSRSLLFPTQEKEQERAAIFSLSEEEESKRWASDVEKGTCWDCRGTTAQDCLLWGRKVDCYDHEVNCFI